MSDQSTTSSQSQTTYQNPQSMVQNIAPDISNTVNTVFSEQRIVESQPAFSSSTMILPKSVEAEMTDETWFAKQQLMKPVQLAQVSWSTTDARDSDIYSCSFPSVLTTVESIVLRTLRMYAYFKMSPCFRIQINSTQFHQGQLICSFDPFSISNRATSDYSFDIFYATGLPNVKIMASESDAVELCIPFIHPVSFWSTNDPDPFSFQNLGEFRISILNPLVVADGTSNAVTVTIWVYAKDAQVHVPIFDHNPIIDPNPPILEATYGISDLTSAVSSIGSEVSSKLSPVLSTIKKGASQTHTLIGNIASGNIGQALRTGQGIIDTLGDLFGFDYPARTLQPPKTISPVENLSVGIGQSQSQRMAIDPFSLHLVEDDVAGERKTAMDLLSICKMPMLLSQFSYTGTSVQDSLLFSCPVTPTVSCLRNNLFRRTYLSAVSNAFCYWNGGINFDIEIVATRFHSGKLLFAFVPNDSNVPSYVSAADGLPNIIIDIQQTSSTRFKVPFVSSKPLKDVQRFNLNNTVATSPTANDSFYSNSCIGTLVCYVQNVLNYASNVSPSVEINMYISAADDFGLYVPGKPVLNQVPPTPPPLLQATSNEIGIDLNKNNTPTTASVLAKGQLDSIPRKHFGENYSLIDIIRRFTFSQSLTVQNTNPTALNVTPYYDDLAINQISYLQYFSYLYSAFSGSIRYKFVTDTTRSQNFPLQITHSPSGSETYVLGTTTDPTLLLSSGLGILRTNGQQDLAIEAEVPYYSKFNMLVPQRGDFLDVSYNGTLYLQTTSTATASLNVDIYTAAGEDFRFIYLRPMRNDSSTLGYYVTSL